MVYTQKIPINACISILSNMHALELESKKRKGRFTAIISTISTFLASHVYTFQYQIITQNLQTPLK